MSLVEQKIREKAYDSLWNVKIVALDHVLEIVNEYGSELAELLKNRPIIHDLGDEVYATDLPKMKQWFDNYEKKVAELGEAKP